MLLNIDIGAQSKVVGYNGMIGTKVRRVFTYRIDGVDRIDGQEVSGRHGKPIHVEVNGPVDYAVDKDHLYLKDSDGKSYKLDLVRTTRPLITVGRRSTKPSDTSRSTRA